MMKNIPNMNIPNVNIPNMNIPNMNIPNMNVPNMNIPNMNIPNMNIPNMNIPNMNIPNMNIPNMNDPMQAIRDQTTQFMSQPENRDFIMETLQENLNGSADQESTNQGPQQTEVVQQPKPVTHVVVERGSDEKESHCCQCYLGGGSDEQVSHCCHCCITFFFPPWLLIWILLCCIYGC